ncbi:MAG: hypothetical protein M9895_04225 [Aquamicrobium sp.]|uniref:hypothetical protein n=1 Tax=Aquamicrobium sp. TaxID=1872579 RepID=UPI00349E98B3|nr:hypothetical protein [Aquamicrobium sp.]MCO5155592.1 hypothetical protein [Aquamicrobium sp.]
MPPSHDNPSSREDEKKARLAERLRANLQRRKAQARSRRAGEADRRPDGLAGTRGEDGLDGDGRGED